MGAIFGILVTMSVACLLPIGLVAAEKVLPVVVKALRCILTVIGGFAEKTVAVLEKREAKLRKRAEQKRLEKEEDEFKRQLFLEQIYNEI